jgi:hypothetical protein
MLQEKLSCMVPKPQRLSDKEIGIQQQITKIVQSYPNPHNISDRTKIQNPGVSHDSF